MSFVPSFFGIAFDPAARAQVPFVVARTVVSMGADVVWTGPNPGVRIYVSLVTNAMLEAL